MFALLNIQ